MISVRNVKKHYGAVKAVDGVTFDCPDGQICGADHACAPDATRWFVTPTSAADPVSEARHLVAPPPRSAVGRGAFCRCRELVEPY